MSAHPHPDIFCGFARAAVFSKNGQVGKRARRYSGFEGEALWAF
jgi:hypothetical protein